eukprot:1958396-Rhodomonas_salina.2
MSHMQLQFSHTGVVAQTSAHAREAHTLTSWMSVEVEVAPLVSDAGLNLIPMTTMMLIEGEDG